jgi:hypothetical protein
MGVLSELLVHPDPAPSRLAHQHDHVEPGEQARGERVRTRRHIDHYVLGRPVDEMVEVQLHRPGLRVVAGHTNVVLGELTSHHQTRPAHRPREPAVQLIIGVITQQPRPATRRRGFDHRGRRGDSRVVCPQVILQPVQIRSECRDRRQGTIIEPQGLAEVLIDVSINGENRKALIDQVPREQRGQCRLTTAALADEGDTHPTLLFRRAYRTYQKR